MSDNIRYDDDFFADSEPKERAPREKKAKPAMKIPEGLSPELLMKIIIAAVAVGAVIIIILGCLVFSSFNKDKDNDSEQTTVSSVEDDMTIGTYTVTIPEDPKALLNLREAASMEAADIAKVPNGAHLMVTEVVEAGGITWGKVTYEGAAGYVNMQYLVKSYTGTVPSTPEQTTKAPEGNSEEKPENEVTTKPAETTTSAPTSSSNSGSAGATGKYVVDAQPELNLRDGHSVDALSIAKIPDKEVITIDEVYYDEDAKDSYTKYWGKTTYQGITGWVAMGYLDSAN